MAQPAPQRRRGPQSRVPPAATRDVPLGLALGGLLAYLAAFFALPMPELDGARRGELLLLTVLRPDDLIAGWTSGASLASLAERGWILVWAFAIVSVAAAAGWILLRLLRVDRLVTRLEMTLLAVIAGLNLVSLATLLLGLVGALRADVFIALGVVTCIAAAAYRKLGGCASGTCSAETDLPSGEQSAWNWSPHWLWLGVPFALAIVGSAMLPPLDFDVREYHLQAPKEFYQAGRITFLPHNIYANMPLGAEMFALCGMVTSGDWYTGALVGKTVIALFAPLGALLLFAAGRRFHSTAAGIVAALVYLSLPWLAIVSIHGLIEGAFACYLLAAFFVALIWRSQHLAPSPGETTGLPSSAAPGRIDQETARLDKPAAVPSQNNLGTLLLSGFLAGAAVSTKYPAVVYCAIPLAVLVSWWSIRARGLRFGVLAVAIFSAGVLLGCGPWLAKNAAFSGNPTYPLAHQVFGGETRTPEKHAQWQRAHRPPNFSPLDFAKRLASISLAGTWLSPLIVPLVILALLNRRTRQLAAFFTAGFLLIFMLWWLLTHRIDRFLVPAWPLAALAAGLGAVWHSGRVWRVVLGAFLAIGLAYDFAVIAGGPVADNRYLAPLAQLRAESAALDPWHTWLNEHAADVRRVLLVGDAQPFDLEVPALYNTVFDDSLLEQLARERSPAQVREALLARGISHIYVAWPEIDRYRSPGNYGITEFLQPAVFAELTSAGVLEPLPMLAASRGQMFRVIAQ